MTVDTATTPAAETRTLPALRGRTAAELSATLAEAGLPAFRGKQLFQWIQRRLATSFAEMKNLGAETVAWLEANTRLGGIRSAVAQKVSDDGSAKFLFDLEDGLKVESVLMPGSGSDADKMTLCVSSQVGCAVDCKFCVTGRNGFFRHMSADEIVDQAHWARRFLREEGMGRTLRNMVFMGMGEPLLNTDNVLSAIRVLTDPEGMDLSPRRITVSTSGVLPGLEELAKADLGVGLAISLNAPTQEERERIMPITKRYPLDQLLAACRAYPLHNRARITFEYVLLAGVNDSPDHARLVTRLVRGIPSKINVIPFNPDPALPYERPGDVAVERFAGIVRGANLTCSVRWSKALDVNGACGQLAGQYRKKMAEGGFTVLPREG